jgi:histidinol-phosphatase (PHP family)
VPGAIQKVDGASRFFLSDSHFPNDLGIYSERIRSMLPDKGVKEIATFEKRQRNMKPL